jgi:hypothetical protein
VQRAGQAVGVGGIGVFVRGTGVLVGGTGVFVGLPSQHVPSPLQQQSTPSCPENGQVTVVSTPSTVQPTVTLELQLVVSEQRSAWL